MALFLSLPHYATKNAKHKNLLLFQPKKQEIIYCFASFPAYSVFSVKILS